MQEIATEGTLARFRMLAVDVREAGLLDRRGLYYFVTAGVTLLAFVAGWVGFVLLGDSWGTLGIAVALGLLYTQLGFLGHDAGHNQVFASRRANRLLGLTVGNTLTGLSFGWWVPKHNAHHAHPNEIGRDPDVGHGLLLPVPTNGGKVASPARTRWRPLVFFLMMLLRSGGLHVSGAYELLRRRDRRAAYEALLLASNAAAYLTVVFWVLSPLEAAAFIAVQQGVFSLYLGCAFAPNHKGMPVLGVDGAALGFAVRQVATARNVTGGSGTALLLGGLNYQIEHHLFPTMPRPNLPRARRLVVQFCADSGLPYCEDSLRGSLRRICRCLRGDERPSILGRSSRSPVSGAQPLSAL